MLYMSELYKSKYYADLRQFMKDGWTEEEINTYFPLLESMEGEELLKLHKLCSITMYRTGENVNKEQAIHVLVNPKDTPKEMLINAIDSIRK